MLRRRRNISADEKTDPTPDPDREKETEPVPIPRQVSKKPVTTERVPKDQFERHTPAWKRALKPTAWIIGSGLAALLLFTLIVSGDLPSVAQLEVYDPKLSTKVYSIDGKVLKEFYRERRTRIPFSEIPKPVVYALLATEDHRFYNHWGVDMIRFVKAAMVNVISMRAKEGFSSLTQQLARNLYLTSEKTVTRKFKEVLTAIQIERSYSKNEIIEMYLTHMNFGGGAYGIHSAAQAYFQKDVKDLTLEESAFLIGLLQAPSYYAGDLDAANRRKNIVLYRMKESGFITTVDYEAAKKIVLEPVVRQAKENIGLAPYFTEYVRLQLEALEKELNVNIYEDGLSVYTTLHSGLQLAAEKAYLESEKEKFLSLDKFGANVIRSNVRDFLPRYLRRDGVDEATITTLMADRKSVDSLCVFYGRVQSSLVALDPTNGHILAMIGGRDFNRYKLNHVTQIKRQPGSSFKVFLYTAAIDNGYSPTYKLLNQDVVLIMEDGKRWTPQNYDESRGGPTTLREALGRSLNLPAIRLMQEVVPPAQVVGYAQRMGISTPLDPVDALALGVSDVIPLEMASAFAVLANKGLKTEPTSILKIEDKDGNILWQNTPKVKEVLSAETAYIMTDMMKGSLDLPNGTGRAARKFFTRPAAVKTGTTQKWSDGWFIGFTPSIVTCVWLGYDTYEFNLGPKNPGGSACAPLWGRFMNDAHRILKIGDEDFEMPNGVVRLEVCSETGLLATPLCPNKVKEIFNARYQPTDLCDRHTGKVRSTKKNRTGY